MEAHAVLIVDADAEARSGVARFLTEHGYASCAVASAARAEQLLTEQTFDCAVVDVVLQDTPGLEAIERFRLVQPSLSVIVTAAENTMELEARIRAQSVVYYYVKSFERDELLQAVARAVGGRYMQKKAKILVVDDDRDYQAAVRQLLESAEYEVVSAYTKEDGLKALAEAEPDLIILDIMMTGMSDGFQFLYEMKAHPEQKAPPVLSVSCISGKTGYKFSPTTDEDYFPADDFLAKPVRPQELLSHVEALLGGYRPLKQS